MINQERNNQYNSIQEVVWSIDEGITLMHKNNFENGCNLRFYMWKSSIVLLDTEKSTEQFKTNLKHKIESIVGVGKVNRIAISEYKKNRKHVRVHCVD